LDRYTVGDAFKEPESPFCLVEELFLITDHPI
jgi:hypothetical protein